MELKKKTNKKLICIILAILGLVLIFAGYFIYKMTYADNGEELKEELEEKLIYNLDVYKYSTGFLCKEYNEEYCKDIAFTIKTKTENTKILAFDTNYKFVLYEDEVLKVYNRTSGESQKLTLENSYKEYAIFTNNNKDNIAGVVYKTSDDKIGYFNTTTGNKLYEGKYDLSNMYELIQINDEYLTTVTDIISLFMKKGEAIYHLKTRDKTEIVYDKTDESRDYPVVVLADGGSASASEVLAGAFKETYHAQIVGTKTYGKGKIQRVYSLSNGIYFILYSSLILLAKVPSGNVFYRSAKVVKKSHYHKPCGAK